MREKLNSNPLAQVAVVGVLLLAAGFFLLSTMGGAPKKKKAPPEARREASVDGDRIACARSGRSRRCRPPGARRRRAPPPLPQLRHAAFAANDTVVLLFVRDGGIDDRMVAADVERLSSLPRGRDLRRPRRAGSPATRRSPRGSTSTGCRRWS